MFTSKLVSQLLQQAEKYENERTQHFCVARNTYVDCRNRRHRTGAKHSTEMLAMPLPPPSYQVHQACQKFWVVVGWVRKPFGCLVRLKQKWQHDRNTHMYIQMCALVLVGRLVSRCTC